MAVAYKEQTVKQGSQKTGKETMKENKDKNRNDKNKEKESILCKAGAFYIVQGIFSVFYAYYRHMCPFQFILNL